MKLEDCRKKIDAIDAEITKLLIERAAIAQEIGQLKMKAGLPILDAERESQILQKVSRQGKGALKDESLVKIYRQILRESRKVQVEALEKLVKEGTETY